jgi:hypothetical protein
VAEQEDLVERAAGAQVEHAEPVHLIEKHALTVQVIVYVKAEHSAGKG